MKNTNRRNNTVVAAGILLSLLATLASAAGFSSGSTGADGAFAPTASITLNVPPNGIFNFTTVNVPSGVTVRFAKNAANTPVTMLATGNVSIAGIIDVSGGASLSNGGVSVASTLGDRSLPGTGGPGGYDGGRGGAPEINRRAGNGLGPGGGGGGDAIAACCGSGGTTVGPQAGGGGGYAVPGNTNDYGGIAGNTGLGGGVYGSNLLTPLVGGSGGGGGAGAQASFGFYGTGGGGGGGAILIAASGTVTITGSILANGGNGGDFSTSNTGILCSQNACPATGGGGSGGAIRIVASNIVNSGSLNVSGGVRGVGGAGAPGGNGGLGRSSQEIVTTGTLMLTGLPTLNFTSVAGVTAPAIPTGAGDVVLPATAPNPATVVFSTTGIPVGNTVRLVLTPQRGAATAVTSPPLTGTLANATTSVDINIPQGISTLTASTTYTITVAMGESLSIFANNERVEKITVAATLGGKAGTKLVTVSGKEYDAPPEAMVLAHVQ